MSQRKQRLEAEIGVFIRQYARKHYPNHDPNDRRYDRRIEKIVRRMNPAELDELMRGADDQEDLGEQRARGLSNKPRERPGPKRRGDASASRAGRSTPGR